MKTTINAERAEHAERKHSAVSAGSALYAFVARVTIVAAQTPVPARHAQLVIVVDGLRLLGIAVPKTMTGRVIDEALRTGPPILSVTIERVADTVKTPDGTYELTVHRSKAAGEVYLDFTDVRRPQRSVHR